MWTLDLRSGLGFHPERLLEGLDGLGGGNHRSRGCFWLPPPEQCLPWDGAGGQFSIGNGQPWGRRTPMARIAITGVGSPLGHLGRVSKRLLMSPADAKLPTGCKVHSYDRGLELTEVDLGIFGRRVGLRDHHLPPAVADLTTHLGHQLADTGLRHHRTLLI